MDISLIGAPGSGKGTQAEKLAQAFTLQHISSGDLFRKAFEDKTELGLLAQTYVDLGELVPDEMTVPMMLSCIEEPESTHGVLLDGFPRTLAQAQALDAELQHIGRQVDVAIYLDVPRDELLKRFEGRLFCQANQHVYHAIFRPPVVDGVCDVDGSNPYQRSADEGLPLRRRLVLFYNEVMQLLDHYRMQNKLREINSNQSIYQVQKALLHVINDAMEKAS